MDTGKTNLEKREAAIRALKTRGELTIVESNGHTVVALKHGESVTTLENKNLDVLLTELERITR